MGRGPFRRGANPVLRLHYRKGRLGCHRSKAAYTFTPPRLLRRGRCALPKRYRCGTTTVGTLRFRSTLCVTEPNSVRPKAEREWVPKTSSFLFLL